MGFLSKSGSNPDLNNGTAIAKSDQDKLKQFAEQLKSVFTAKIELKDIGLEWEIGNFQTLHIQNYSPLKIVDDHKKFISLNDFGKIINNLDIKKAPGIVQINNKLIKHIKLCLIKFIYLFFNLCIDFVIHPSNWKISKAIDYVT